MQLRIGGAAPVTAPQPESSECQALRQGPQQHQAAEAAAAADAVTDAVIAAPDAWRQRIGGVAADGAMAIAAVDAAPSPPATRSAMRAAAAAAAQLRASSG
jgi:hypothetical protein